MKATNKNKLFSKIIDLFISLAGAIAIYFCIDRPKFLYFLGPIEYILLVQQSLLLVYYIIFYSITSGKTIGRILLSNRVISINGKRMNFKQILLRSLMQCILALELVSILYQFYNKSQESLFSKTTNTTVISTKKNKQN